MMFERKIVVGIDDIKAITFECKGCGVRTTIPIDKLKEVPQVCGSCKEQWWSHPPAGHPYVTTTGPAMIAFIDGLIRSRNLILENKQAVDILLVFDEPDGE